MTNWTTMPFEKLVAYQVARELLVVVRDAAISDSKLRDQAMRAAMSVCLNIAEASGRQSAADQKRVFAIARGEASEAAAALDIASVAGLCSADSARIGGAIARRAYALLTGLIRC
jgi:four helix bundle protein